MPIATYKLPIKHKQPPLLPFFSKIAHLLYFCFISPLPLLRALPVPPPSREAAGPCNYTIEIYTCLEGWEEVYEGLDGMREAVGTENTGAGGKIGRNSVEY